MDCKTSITNETVSRTDRPRRGLDERPVIVHHRTPIAKVAPQSADTNGRHTALVAERHLAAVGQLQVLCQAWTKNENNHAQRLTTLKRIDIVD